MRKAAASRARRQDPEAYLRVKSINVGTDTIELHVYAPPPDDAVRGIMFHAYDDFSDNEILADLQASNPDMPIVSGRRMGQTRHIVVALTAKTLPKWIFYHGTDIRLYPFYNRVEACFNCRKVGHRTDVCPLPRKQRCRRCGEEHPPREKARNPSARRAASSAVVHTTPAAQTASIALSRKRHPPAMEARSPRTYIEHQGNPSHSGPSSSRSPSPRDHSPSFPPPGTSSSQHKGPERRSRSQTRRVRSRSAQRRHSNLDLAHSARRPTQPDAPLRRPGHPVDDPEKRQSLAWQRGPPASLLSSDAQVRELAKENSALKAQISAQQSQIAKLTSYIKSLEAKIDRALNFNKQTATPTPSQTQETHPNSLTTNNTASAPAPQPPNANKRKVATPTASLHAEVDITATVTTAVTAAIHPIRLTN
ncbi:hypothetical protein HPB52_025286 [Rhipicephalus sanguineus]|uniref:CCHC-type domain-containing protein n=1 Tax=Rhipicephalus sanguineus TaxID=34632 RepID=A0A9D4TD75_RHISA|nr:hypothetical protein HPB52_025286 [Rhipicephalus sanguineus]